MTGRAYRNVTSTARTPLTAAQPRATIPHMDTDDIAPPTRPNDPLTLAVKQDLDPYSVTELETRIATLETEILRTRAHRDKAVNHRASADALFGG